MSKRTDDFGKMETGKLYVGLHETDSDMAELWYRWTNDSLPSLAAVFHADFLPDVQNDDTDRMLQTELVDYMKDGGLVPLTWHLEEWAFAILDSMTIDEFFAKYMKKG